MKISRELNARIENLRRMNERVEVKKGEIAKEESALAVKRNAWHDAMAAAILSGAPNPDEPDDMKADEAMLATNKGFRPALQRAYESEAVQVAALAHDELQEMTTPYLAGAATVRDRLYHNLFNAVIALGLALGTEEARNLLELPPGATREKFTAACRDGFPENVRALNATIHDFSGEVAKLQTIKPAQVLAAINTVLTLNERIHARAV